MRVANQLRGYKPQPITPSGVLRWVRQFPIDLQIELVKLAANLRFLSETETTSWLVGLNNGVLERLRDDDIDISSVIYVSTDTPGSSSGVMLNLVRDHANLERRRAIFLHHTEAGKIQKTTMRLKRGAIVYVDDFAGTGKQFMRSRKNVAEYVVGAFSEFLLLPCICEEAKERIEQAGVETQSGFVHHRSERPLLNGSDLLDRNAREEIIALSEEQWGRRVALGFDGLATNVIIYRNSPNTTPLLFRGHIGQEPRLGIVPRFDERSKP